MTLCQIFRAEIPKLKADIVAEGGNRLFFVSFFLRLSRLCLPEITGEGKKSQLVLHFMHLQLNEKFTGISLKTRKIRLAKK